MRRHFIFAALLTAVSFCTADAAALSAPVQITPQQQTSVNASLKLARRAIELQKFTRAEAELKKVLAIDPDNREALRLQSTISEALERQRRVEKSALDAAVREGTVEALQRFLKDFNGSPYCKDAQERIDDFEFWQTARNANTREAYESYLATSRVKSYKAEARAALDNIAAHEEWQIIKDMPSAVAFEDYMSKFPTSPHIKEARARRNVLKGRAAYSAGDKVSAKSYYDEALAEGAQFSDDDRRYYGDLEDYERYVRLSNSNDIGELKDYLSHITASSPYHNGISNRLARLQADRLDSYSADYDYSNARYYACDAQTRSYVDSRINSARNARTYREKQLKAERRRERWRDRVRLGWNILSFDVMENTMSFSTGLRLRFGRHTDFLNFTIGVDYTYIMAYGDTYYDNYDYGYDYGYNYYSYYDNYDSDYGTVGHYVTFPVNLKFNLFRLSDSCKFYLGCTGEYGLLISSGDYEAESGTIAIAPTIGFNFKHGDIGFYYKRYLDDHSPSYIDDLDIQRIGVLFTWYF